MHLGSQNFVQNGSSLRFTLVMYSEETPEAKRVRKVINNIPIKYFVTLWWSNWHWGKFFSEYFGFPLSVLHSHLNLSLT